jgi:hypothetical protein
LTCNARMSTRQLKAFCALDDSTMELPARHERSSTSAPAPTTASLKWHAPCRPGRRRKDHFEHVSEAIQHRSLTGSCGRKAPGRAVLTRFHLPEGSNIAESVWPSRRQLTRELRLLRDENFSRVSCSGYSWLRRRQTQHLHARLAHQHLNTDGQMRRDGLAAWPTLRMS